MASLHYFTITIIFLEIMLIMRAYSIPYKNIYLTLPTTPRLIHTASESKPAFSGYSYMTQHLNGGGSNVIFATGADSMSKLRDEMSLIHETDATEILTKYSQKDMLHRTQENPMSLKEQQSKSEEIEANMRNHEDIDKNAKFSNNENSKLSKNLEADNNFINPQASSQQVSFVHLSYPVLRENLLNFHLPHTEEFTRYHISPNAIQNQYYLSPHYARLELPLYNFDFYNSILPLDQTTVTSTTSTVPVTSLRNEKSTITEDMKNSTKLDNIEGSPVSVDVSKFKSTESNVIKLRSDLKSVINAVEETTLHKSVINESGSTTISEDVKDEITTTESIKSPVKFRNCEYDQNIEMKKLTESTIEINTMSAIKT